MIAPKNVSSVTKAQQRWKMQNESQLTIKYEPPLILMRKTETTTKGLFNLQMD